MKIIGSGFGRTGTASMKQALQQLGFDPCYHMEDVLKNPSNIKLWHDVAMGQSKNWDKIFDGYQAAVDFPVCIFYKELMEKYPDAKVIHTTRNSERWYDSTYETIYKIQDVFPRWLTTIFRPLGQFNDMVEKLVWSGIFNGNFEDRETTIKIFEDFTAEVKQTVPSERLLMFEVKQGWKPLCEFLGVPVPNTPFPHVNDRKQLLNQMKKMRLVTRLAPIAATVLLIIGVLLLSAIF